MSIKSNDRIETETKGGVTEGKLSSQPFNLDDCGSRKSSRSLARSKGTHTRGFRKKVSTSIQEKGGIILKETECLYDNTDQDNTNDYKEEEQTVLSSIILELFHGYEYKLSHIT